MLMRVVMVEVSLGMREGMIVMQATLVYTL